MWSSLFLQAIFVLQIKFFLESSLCFTELFQSLVLGTVLGAAVKKKKWLLLTELCCKTNVALNTPGYCD